MVSIECMHIIQRVHIGHPEGKTITATNPF